MERTWMLKIQMPSQMIIELIKKRSSSSKMELTKKNSILLKMTNRTMDLIASARKSSILTQSIMHPSTQPIIKVKVIMMMSPQVIPTKLTNCRIITRDRMMITLNKLMTTVIQIMTTMEIVTKKRTHRKIDINMIEDTLKSGKLDENLM